MGKRTGQAARAAIGAALKARRLGLGLLQHEVAARLHMPSEAGRATVLQVEAGRRSVRLEEVCDWARAYDLPPSALIALAAIADQNGRCPLPPEPAAEVPGG